MQFYALWSPQISDHRLTGDFLESLGPGCPMWRPTKLVLVHFNNNSNNFSVSAREIPYASLHGTLAEHTVTHVIVCTKTNVFDPSFTPLSGALCHPCSKIQGT
jgi:hypothetical protein